MRHYIVFYWNNEGNRTLLKGNLTYEEAHNYCAKMKKSNPNLWLDYCSILEI